MRKALGVTMLAAALGMLGGWIAAAQETGAIPEQNATTKAQTGATADNGALPGDSHVRIVRLSEVRGVLALDRKTGLGFEQTMQNMPIVEGEKLQMADGYAEVEFEDNTTLRLAPNSRVDFSLLALRNTGAKASTMNVVRGTVYVNTESTKGNEFLLVAGEAKMMVSPSTHLRLEVADGKTLVSVFNGSVEVQRGSETTVVAKKESLNLDANQMTVAKKVVGEPYDAWDKESIDYHQRYAMANTFAGGGNSYGLSDLNYYGNFINVNGFGQIWQPFLIGSGWSPYANGLWAFYPGAGYSWVSPYPWGWLPYHSGSWGFYPGVGWGWAPGGSWNGLNNIPTSGALAGAAVGSPVASGVRSPLRAAALPQAPAAEGATRPSIVLANQSPLVFSKEDKPGNFVFQKDSAGLGVPRGSLGALNKISNDVGRHGSASMEVYASGGEVEHGVTRGPVTLRAGSTGGSGNGNLSAESRAAFQGQTGAQNGTQPTSASRSGGGFSQAAAPAGSSGASSGGSNGGGTSHGPIAAPK